MPAPITVPNRERPPSMRLWTAAAACLGLVALAFAAPPRSAVSDPANPAVTPEQATFFETRVRPLLVSECVPCHGKDNVLGGLRLDTRAGLLKGGTTGASLVAGDPDHSLLITAVRQTGALKMPQGGRLKPDDVTTLETWVKMGAPWPESSPASAATTEAWRLFWSLQPVRSPAVPNVKNKAWVRNPIDAFVLSALEAKSLTPAAAADRRTLLRRTTFDLTGLPPTPGETEAFLADKSTNAYEKVVDRLLASPRYGECWARHWLDVARYADTKGYVFTEDRAYPNAYTYRDWVIHSFNDDLPYDKFTYQLAADLAPEVKNGDDKRPLAALGFLTVGRRFLNSTPDIMDDRIDVTMRGFEGATVACARCHDHKFDPIPTADYYSLYGVFDAAAEASTPISPKAVSAPWEAYNAQKQAAETEKNRLILEEIKGLRIREKQNPMAFAEPVRNALQAVRENQLPDSDKLAAMESAFLPDGKAKLATVRTTLDTLAKNPPTTPEMAMALTDKDNPGKPVIFKRGNPNNRGDVVPRRFLSCLFPAGSPRPEWNAGSGRLELARAIASKNNPRTARVFANRVWLYHFGFGLVRTPSDFGKQGERPTHPDLLDYLASRFMSEGWSIKKLHRLILLSSTYRQSSDVSPRAAQVDPENRLLSHQNRRRLDLEQMRDSLLSASGTLDVSRVGGTSVDLWKAPFTPRRAVYGFVERQNLPGTFRTFDFASPDATSAQRFRTTVPQQALFLMNSPFAVAQATTLASLVIPAKATDSDEARGVRRLYLRLFGRLPDTDETAAALAYLRAPDMDAAQTLAALTPLPVWQNGWGGWDETAKQITFAPLTKFDSNDGKWHYTDAYPAPDASGYLQLTANGGHPGRDATHAAIRRWTAPRDGTVTVSGTLKHPSDQGDGVRGRLVSSRLGLLGEWVAQHGEAKTVVASIAVQKGDTLDFVTDCRAGGDAFDGFSWSPVALLVGSPPTVKAVVWDSRRDFSGPQPVPPRR